MPPTLPNTLTHILAEFVSNLVISILKDIFQYIPKPVNRQRNWCFHVENTLQQYHERMFFQTPPFGLEEAFPQLFKVHGSCILSRNHKQLKGSWARGVQYEWILYTESSEWTDYAESPLLLTESLAASTHCVSEWNASLFTPPCCSVLICVYLSFLSVAASRCHIQFRTKHTSALHKVNDSEAYYVQRSYDIMIVSLAFAVV